MSVPVGDAVDVEITAHAPAGVATPASVTLEVLPHTYFLPGHPDPDCNGTNAGMATCRVALNNGIATIAVQGVRPANVPINVDRNRGVFPGGTGTLQLSVPRIGASPPPASSGSAGAVVAGGFAGKPTLTVDDIDGPT